MDKSEILLPLEMAERGNGWRGACGNQDGAQRGGGARGGPGGAQCGGGAGGWGAGHNAAHGGYGANNRKPQPNAYRFLVPNDLMPKLIGKGGCQHL